MGVVANIAAGAEGRFEIVRVLGEGGFGIVYEAFDRERGLHVALKSLKRLGPRARERFRSEFRGLADLTHENLPLFFELFTSGAGDDWFFTMELVAGPTLDVWVRVRNEATIAVPSQSGIGTMSLTASLDRQSNELMAAADVHPRGITSAAGTFSEERLRASLAQLRTVLAFIHSRGHVHRDVKPSNVRVRPSDGRVFLLDFGLAGRVGDVEEHFLGTPSYAAPEQARKGAATAAVDAYALGSMLFELLTGRLPFHGSGDQMLLDKQTRRPPAIRDVALDVPDDLASLVDAWLEPSPASRAPIHFDVIQASSLQAEPFVGRTHELELLRDAFEQVLVANDTRVVLIEAESGMGKTLLIERALDDMRARAREANRHVSIRSGRPSPKERVPFNAFEGTAFEPTAIREVLERHTKAGPLVLWIDDLQWADDDSMKLLVALLRPPQLRPALFILSRRPPATDDEPLVLPCARRVVRLGPLAVDEAEQLARSVGADDARSLNVALRSGGHPLFVRELCRSSSKADENAALDEVLARRIALQPRTQIDLLELLSMSHGALTEDQLARAGKRPRGEVARDLEILRRTQLVRTDPRAGVGFLTYHDRVREVVAASLSDADRRRIHEALLEVLDAEHELTDRLDHLLGAERREEAALVAREAAQASVEAKAYARAARLLGEALRLGYLSPDDERAVRVRRVEVLEAAHRGLDAAEEALQVAERTTDAVDAEAWRMRAARLFLAVGDLKRGRAVLSGILAHTGLKMPNSEAETLLSLVQSRILAGRELKHTPVSEEERRSERARKAAREYALLRVVADGFSMTDHVRGHAFQARSLRAAIASHDPLLRAEALLIDALYIGSNDAKDRVKAETRIDAAFALFPDNPPPLVSAWASVVRATLEKHERPSAVVADMLHEAEKAFVAIGGDSWILGSIRLVRGHCMRLYGDLPALRKQAMDLVDDAERRRDLFVLTTAHLGGLVVWLADDAPLAARQVLSQVRWPEERGTFLVQHWLSIEAEVEIALYEHDGARLLETIKNARHFLRFSLLKRLQSVRICCNYTLGRALLASIEAQTRLKPGRLERIELGFVIRSLRKENTGYASVRASLLAAGLHALDGDRESALAELERVETIGREADMILDPLAASYLATFLNGDLAKRRKTALAELQALGVKAPRRFMRVVAPGFERYQT